MVPARGTDGPTTASRAAAVAAGAARRVWLGITALVLMVIALQLVVADSHDWYGHWAIDYQLYVEVTRRWLAGGEFYQSWQLAGSYRVADPYGSVLYPPVAIWLFGPFTVLPAVLWWILPLGAVAWTVWRHKPEAWAWPVMALCVAWPPSIVKLVTGNPVMWAAACVALGTIYAWPSVFAVLKPSVFPFALRGVRSRGWWLGLALIVVASLPFGAMWGTWLITVLNARDGGLLYSILEVPLLALPLIAWTARPRTPAEARAGSPASLRRIWARGTVG
jgi:hypothetical protein